MITDLQRIHIKILTDAPADLKLGPFIEIFGRWRMEKDHQAGWVDLADYAHVPRGMGIVLVGFRANFSFDMSDPAPGILYAAKKGLTGTHAERIVSVLKSCFELSQRLIAEKEFPPGVRLRTGALEILFPDRLVTPNTKETDAELRPAVEAALTQLYRANGATLTAPEDAGRAYGFSVRAKTAEPLELLGKRLG
ncbi:MAG: hypothetical protein HY316_03825 [Acidobacteria bacterium]|nr:hypothetical protein [Acidobacteriota bacterium]